ncbi:hypothetical protein C6376_08060 [Streptomyces sp. P3]|uniref:hypothetical protein n=1 Tax=Streptomyces sp. P3 TaxID=2135430 RepID=UPI000D1A4F9A|nr:hypothetical protein [Streptomyces sp. P3]AVV41399.1 hypothetical protein C6376_08060 [Streptomyces sp. P3]
MSTTPILTVLAVADAWPRSQLDPFLAHEGWLAERGVSVRLHTYAEVRKGVHGLRGPVGVVLFFPHQFWDARIEDRVAGAYGTRAYADALSAYLLSSDRLLRRSLPQGVHYLNPPTAVARTRDKALARRVLEQAGIPVPPAIENPTPEELSTALDAGRSLYVKAVCGSMGKGITHLAPGRWRTNYAYHDGRLESPGNTFGEQWVFRDVDPGDEGFLAALCAESGFVFEHEVGMTVGGAKTELRVTVANGCVIDIEERHAPAGSVTTRSVEHGRTVVEGPMSRSATAGQTALYAARALGLRYAVFDMVTDDLDRSYVLDAQAFPATGTEEDFWRKILGVLVPPTTPRPAREGYPKGLRAT